VGGDARRVERGKVPGQRHGALGEGCVGVVMVMVMVVVVFGGEVAGAGGQDGGGGDEGSVGAGFGVWRGKVFGVVCLGAVRMGSPL
jgi:hypothetical protein